MVPPLHAQVVKVTHAARVSDALSKVASQQAMLMKVIVDGEIFGMANYNVKTAAVSDPVRDMANKLAELAVSVYGFNKLASLAPVTENPILEDAVSKMATVGAIEGLLNTLPTNLTPETQKLAMEIRALNRGYGVQILNDLLS